MPNFGYGEFQTKPGMIDPLAVLYGHGNVNAASPYAGPGWRPDWSKPVPPPPPPPVDKPVVMGDDTPGNPGANPRENDFGGGGQADANNWGGGGTAMDAGGHFNGSMLDISGLGDRIGAWASNPANLGTITGTVGGIVGQAVPGIGGLAIGPAANLAGNLIGLSGQNRDLASRGVTGRLGIGDAVMSTIGSLGHGLAGWAFDIPTMQERSDTQRREGLARGEMGGAIPNMEGPQDWSTVRSQDPQGMSPHMFGTPDEIAAQQVVEDSPGKFSVPGGPAAAAPGFSAEGLPGYGNSYGYAGAPSSNPGGFGSAMGAPAGQTGYASGTTVSSSIDPNTGQPGASAGQGGSDPTGGAGGNAPDSGGPGGPGGGDTGRGDNYGGGQG